MLLDKRKGREVQIPTASMADIAFLLLTFFLVTTSLDMDKGLMSTLPPRGEAQEIPKKNIASIFITADGEVGLEAFDTNGLMTIPIKNIKPEIKRRVDMNDKLTVSIKTDKNTQYQVFMSVLDQVQMAFADNPRISIAEPDA